MIVFFVCLYFLVEILFKINKNLFLLLICECIEYVKFCFFLILLNSIEEGFFLNIIFNIINV